MIIREPRLLPNRIDRFNVRLPCQVLTSDASYHATVINIGYGGLGLEFEEGTLATELVMVQTVDARYLGVFDVEGRWIRGNRLGVRFIDIAGAKVRVQDYLRAHGFD